MTSLVTCWEFPTLSSTYSTRGRLNMRLRKTGLNVVDQNLARTSSWKSVTLAMDAGPITTSRQRSRRDSIVHLKSLSGLSMEPVPICGPSPAWYLRWQQETSYLSLERVKSMERMTIIWLRWWNFWEGCPNQWHYQDSVHANTSTLMDTWGILED